MIHTTIGLYSNGDYVINGVKPEHLKEHIAYNIKYRAGRTLFVDGHLVHKGYHSDKEIKEFKYKNLVADKVTSPYK